MKQTTGKLVQEFIFCSSIHFLFIWMKPNNRNRSSFVFLWSQETNILLTSRIQIQLKETTVQLPNNSTVEIHVSVEITESLASIPPYRKCSPLIDIYMLEQDIFKILALPVNFIKGKVAFSQHILD